MKSVYWIRHAGTPKLAIVARPRGGDWLNDDLLALKHEGANVVVSLLTTPEEEELGLSDERRTAESMGLQFFSYPVPDREVPSDLQSFRRLALLLADDVRSGKAIGAHCRGCIGRATIVAAAILVELGWSAEAALSLVEEARGCSVPDTQEQQNWIRRYASDTRRLG